VGSNNSGIAEMDILEIEKKQRRRSAQWPAQFLVAAELARQGYNVAFTMGNATPVADLMVGHPLTGDQFWVDVKGQWTKSSWWGNAKKPRRNLFYILVLVGKDRSADRFFVLTQSEFNGLIANYKKTHPKQRPVGGFNWKDPQGHEAAWIKLPSWNETPPP
jgi:hypothetical protein